MYITLLSNDELRMSSFLHSLSKRQYWFLLCENTWGFPTVWGWIWSNLSTMVRVCRDHIFNHVVSSLICMLISLNVYFCPFAPRTVTADWPQGKTIKRPLSRVLRDVALRCAQWWYASTYVQWCAPRWASRCTPHGVPHGAPHLACLTMHPTLRASWCTLIACPTMHLALRASLCAPVWRFPWCTLHCEPHCVSYVPPRIAWGLPHDRLPRGTIWCTYHMSKSWWLPYLHSGDLSPQNVQFPPTGTSPLFSSVTL